MRLSAADAALLARAGCVLALDGRSVFIPEVGHAEPLYRVLPRLRAEAGHRP